MRVTTPARTAFDIARRRRLDAAIASLDALGNATGLSAQQVRVVSRGSIAARVGCGSSQRRSTSYDPGAASPKETWLRLLVIRADYPRPQTQIPVLSADGFGGTTSTWAGRN